MSKLKLTTLLIAITFVAATLVSNAASYTTSKNNVVSINPLPLTYGFINASLEHKMSPDNSITFNAGLWTAHEHWTGINIGACYKWYIDAFEEKKSALNGLAVGPRLDFIYWSTDYDFGPYLKDYGSYSAFALGAEVSYKWAFSGGKWAVEPLFNFTIPLLKKDYGFNHQAYGFGVNLGYCF